MNSSFDTFFLLTTHESYSEKIFFFFLFCYDDRHGYRNAKDFLLFSDDGLKENFQV